MEPRFLTSFENRPGQLPPDALAAAVFPDVHRNFRRIVIGRQLRPGAQRRPADDTVITLSYQYRVPGVVAGEPGFPLFEGLRTNIEGGVGMEHRLIIDISYSPQVIQGRRPDRQLHVNAHVP